MEMANSFTVEVAAPAETMWNLVTDVENYPDISPNLQGVIDFYDGDGDDELEQGRSTVKKKKKVQVGASWTEKRIWSGNKMILLAKKVVRISDNPLFFTFHMQLQKETPLFYWGADDVVTGTLMVLPVDEGHCHLVFSTAACKASRIGSVLLRLCLPCLLRYSAKYHHAELEGYAAIAEEIARTNEGRNGEEV